MTKLQLIKQISEETGCTQCVCEKVISAFIHNVKGSLSLTSVSKITLRGLGTFCNIKRAKKIARNISTGEQIIIPARYEPVFKVSKKLKNAVSKIKIK